MSIYDMAHDEAIFPDSYTFNPDRWLGGRVDGQNQKQLLRYMVSFGKGNRICLGMHLAYAEIFLALATLFRRFKTELYETDRTDVDLAHDMFMPHPRKGSKGVRVKIL